MLNKTTFSTILASVAAIASAGAFTLNVDGPAITRIFDDFNDGVDTSTNFFNMAAGGEAGGFGSVTMPPGADDPQFQYPTPGAPFDIATYPYMRVQSRGSAAGGSQIFPLPPAAPTVLSYGVGTAFSENQFQFIGPVNGTGLRIDPLGDGTANTETFDYDYIHLDRFQTIGLGEFDHDGGLDGWTPNAHIAGGTVSAATSSFIATTSGVDPILSMGGLNIDTNIYNILEVSLAVDPTSSSRFEFFWGTSTFPGPAAGQSIAIVGDLIRDGNLHTYRFDMSDEARWDGILNNLRLDPLADGLDIGKTFEIGHVRAIAGPIPEPGSIALLGLGALAFLRRRRRRRRRCA